MRQELDLVRTRETTALYAPVEEVRTKADELVYGQIEQTTRWISGHWFPFSLEGKGGRMP